jgi:hypothetical protein
MTETIVLVKLNSVVPNTVQDCDPAEAVYLLQTTRY